MRLSNLVRVAYAAVAACSVVALVGCSAAPAKDTAASTDAGPSTTPASSTHPGPTGTACTSVTQTYSTCETTSLCPDVRISQTDFSQCGYVIHGSAIDPECLCSGSMCPMGAPQTCSDMAALLASGITYMSVCNQVAGGHCANVGSLLTSDSCALCKRNCDNVISCIQNCGC